MAAELTLRDEEGPEGALVVAWLATKRSPHTRAAYLRDLAQWASWLAGRSVALLEADETAAAMWARHLEGAGVKDSTAARKLTAVSSFYGWCARRGHIRANPVAGLPRPAVDYDTSATPGLTRDQAVALLEAADGGVGPQAARSAALVATLLFTGARVSELLGADIEDLGTNRGHRVLQVRRKGGKIQALALPAPAASRIDAYLAGRDDVTVLPALPGSTATAARRRVLFATGTGARMYRAEVRALLRRLGHAAGLPAELATSLSPHSMRHAFATLNLDAGTSLRDLQDAMGHVSPRTTRRYDRSRGEPGPLPWLPARGVHQPRPLNNPAEQSLLRDSIARRARCVSGAFRDSVPGRGRR
jgi:site-specific recombinase XerD